MPNKSNIKMKINFFSSTVAAFKLLRTKDMLLLCVCIAYTGFELTFFSGVYGTCVGMFVFFDSNDCVINFYYSIKDKVCICVFI